jgi:hypothetical protein
MAKLERTSTALAALALLSCFVSLPGIAADSVTAFGRVADPAVLAEQRGGSEQVFNMISVEGAVHGNSATNTISGPNTITNGSFARANGMATAIQNSGNNVLIQNATILRIELR